MTRNVKLLIGGIVLAAGCSRRYGSDKREARLPDGDTLLERTVTLMRQCVDDVVIVLAPTDSAADNARRLPGVEVLRSPRSAGGMGFTLADAAIQMQQRWDACLVSLADKPFIAPGSLRAVRDLLCEHDLVMPTYQHAWGHPVGFARQQFLALTRLEGERGARALIARERAHCCFVELDDPGIVADIDTPAQLAYWSSSLVIDRRQSA